MTDQLDDDERSDKPCAEWTTDPMTNFPVGPDDAGNVVMHGIGFVVRGWRWLVRGR